MCHYRTSQMRGLNDAASELGSGVIIDSPRRREQLAAVAERLPAHVARLFGSCDLVANSFANHFPLELGKRQEDVQGESAHACGCIELLGYRDEGDTPS